MRPLSIVVICLSLATAGCTASVGANPLLDDPDLVAQLDLEVPTDIDWERSVRDVRVAGSGTPVNDHELALLDAALSDLHSDMIDWAGLDTIYRIRSDPRLEPGTLAFSRGANIYLLDETFAGTGRALLTEILAHELAHVAQFNALTNDDIAALREATGIVDPISGSDLVRRFGAEVGWVDHAPPGASPQWHLTSAVGTSEYGATAPTEDMAESLARFATGRAAVMSHQRVIWISEWTGLTPAAASAGQPWVPSGAQSFTTNQPVYDIDAVARLSPRNTDVQYYVLPASSSDTVKLVQEVQSQLGTRGFAGTLQVTADERLPRYSGLFTRADGVRLWVEVWDFRFSTAFSSAPDGPVLSYVTTW